MCGLVGVASSNPMVDDLKFFRDALICDTLRGEHSTGIAAVGDDEVYIHKQVGGGHALVQSARYEAMVTAATKLTHSKDDLLLLGHNRYATMGTVSRKTAHPFRHNHIIGMHNGTLDWHSHLAGGRGKHFDVDSEAVIFALSMTDVPKEVLEDLPGAFALTWYNTKDKTLNIARNDERRLSVALSADKSTIAWASEEEMLVWLLNRTYKGRKFTYYDMPIGEHWAIPFKDTSAPLNDVVVTKFKPSDDRTIYGNSKWGSYGVSYGGDDYLGIGNDYTIPNNRLYPGNHMPTKSPAIPSTTRVTDFDLVAGKEEAIILTEFRYFTGGNIYGKAYGYLESRPTVSVEVSCSDLEYACKRKAFAIIPHTFHQRDAVKLLVCTNFRRLPPPNSTKDEETTPKKWTNTLSGALETTHLQSLLSSGCSWCSSYIPLADAPKTTIDEPHGVHPTVLCKDCLEDEPWKGEDYAG